MLVHICCAVDSHYFLEKIKDEFPNENLVGYFYDPNIHPYSEYRLRYLDVEYSCKKLGIKLIEGEYNLEAWLKKVKGMEHLPEKGDRCTVCYDDRLENSVLKAKELGENSFTTTLLISPKKSQEKLDIIGKFLAKKHNLEFIFKDYRSGNGSEIQGQRVKENSLYRQNYCGCLFGLTSQREHQKKIMDEMFSPISKQILPESIEQRLELYQKRNDLEDSKTAYKIIKQKFLNYRLLFGKVLQNKNTLASYIFAYSVLSRKQSSSKVEFQKDNIFYLAKDEIKLISLDYFNLIAKRDYKSTLELIYNPLCFEEELKIRYEILKNPYDLSPLIVLDEINLEKYEFFIDGVIYEDVKEEILWKF